MADWNFDMEAAPRSEMVTQTITDKHGKTSTRETLEKVVIIVATQCGKVTQSYWMPSENRWCMCTKEKPPIAWQPYYWPEHPYAIADRERVEEMGEMLGGSDAT